MSEVMQWVKNIAIYLILIGLIFQILPHNRYRKYIQFLSGLILVLLVASPLLNVWGLEDKFLQTVNQITFQQGSEELKQEIGAASDSQYGGLLTEYKTMMKEKVEEMAAARGYHVLEFSVDLEENPEMENFCEIFSMNVTLGTMDEDTFIWIEPIAVGEGEGEATSVEMPELKADILAFYEMEEDKLNLRLKE